MAWNEFKRHPLNEQELLRAGGRRLSSTRPVPKNRFEFLGNALLLYKLINIEFILHISMRMIRVDEEIRKTIGAFSFNIIENLSDCIYFMKDLLDDVNGDWKEDLNYYGLKSEDCQEAIDELKVIENYSDEETFNLSGRCSNKAYKKNGTKLLIVTILDTFRYILDLKNFERPLEWLSTVMTKHYGMQSLIHGITSESIFLCKNKIKMGPLWVWPIYNDDYINDWAQHGQIYFSPLILDTCIIDYLKGGMNRSIFGSDNWNTLDLLEKKVPKQSFRKREQIVLLPLFHISDTIFEPIPINNYIKLLSMDETSVPESDVKECQKIKNKYEKSIKQKKSQQSIKQKKSQQS